MEYNDPINVKRTVAENKLVQARRKSLEEFGNIEHRLELVDVINGVDYINDSKATDVNSTWYSLYYMNQPVVWIIGNSELETDYSLFSEIAMDKVKAIVCLGGRNVLINNALQGKVDTITDAHDLDEAVRLANSHTEEGDVVLFSPACSSFDLFQNYKDRGQQFRKSVSDLRK
ncbi:MAG: glutamate ligase domain-containing protein [Salibacteraceae bacterium]